jgi:NAD dependent epimerase/dehydratase family enzyme
MIRRVLVTGAMGRVAQQLLPGLPERFEVRLMDRFPDSDRSGSGMFVGELTDRELLAEAVTGVDAVVHLAGNPDPQAPWQELRDAVSWPSRRRWDIQATMTELGYQPERDETKGRPDSADTVFATCRGPGMAETDAARP